MVNNNGANELLWYVLIVKKNSKNLVQLITSSAGS
jgi:hypothetical protein